MGEFSVRDFVCPGTRVGSVEDLKVRFNLLVNMFCFTVGLWVVCSRKGEIVVEEFSKLLGKGRCELWTLIGDDLIVQSEAQVNFVEKEGGYPFGGDGFLSRAEDYSLCKAKVDHDQQGIEARGSGKVGDEVTRDLLEGVRCVGLDQSEWGDSEVCSTCSVSTWHSLLLCLVLGRGQV